MPSVTLTAPVTHDEEDLQPGDVIRDLSEKEARRLVNLGFATMGESVTVDDGQDEAEDIPVELSPEEVAEINAMRKDALLAALKEAGVECSNSENKSQLAAKLMKAWAVPGGDDNAESDDDAE